MIIARGGELYVNKKGCNLSLVTKIGDKYE